MEESERRRKGVVSDSGVRGTRRGGLSAPGLAKRRELEKSGYDDDASPTLGYEYLASKAGLSQAELEIISKHTDQIHLEFVVKMAIACVVLVCLVVWFAWSFWRDSRRRRGGGSHRRSVNRQDRELEPPGSLDSSVGTPGSIPSNAPAAYQRDALALGDQDSNVVTEFLNPLWVSGRREDGADTAVGGAGGVEARDRPTQDQDGAGSAILPRSEQYYLHKEYAPELERRRGTLHARATRNLPAED